MRLTGAEFASANIVEDMLLPAWRSIGHDFLLRCGSILPEEFQDREKLTACFEEKLREEAEERRAPSPETLRMEVQNDPDFYGPFFYRALRGYFQKPDPENDDLRRRIDVLIAAQKRFCKMMEDDNIFQFITSDHRYECIVGSNKKSWPKGELSPHKSSRLEKITAKADHVFALNRNDVDVVPRSLLLLTEVARIDCHPTPNPAAHINAVLIRCGYPGLYARRRLDQFVLAALASLKMSEEDSDSLQESSESIIAGFHDFLQEWLMEPVRLLDKKLKVEKYKRLHDADLRENPRRSK